MFNAKLLESGDAGARYAPSLPDASLEAASTLRRCDDALAHAKQEPISVTDLELGYAIYGPMIAVMITAMG